MRSESRRGYKAAHCSLLISTPQSHFVRQLPGRGAFWCGTNSNIKPALKGDSSRARPVGDAARGESGGIGSIASGSAARRPYSNQRCGFRVAKAGGVIKRFIALCLSQPLSLTSFDSSPAGEPFGVAQKLTLPPVAAALSVLCLDSAARTRAFLL